MSNQTGYIPRRGKISAPWVLVLERDGKRQATLESTDNSSLNYIMARWQEGCSMAAVIELARDSGIKI